MGIYEEFRRLGYSEEESRKLEKDSKINSSDMCDLSPSYSLEEIEEILKEQGITIKNPDGSMKDFYSVINDVATKYSSLKYNS